jgi:hypothetical protein
MDALGEQVAAQARQVFLEIFNMDLAVAAVIAGVSAIVLMGAYTRDWILL